MPMVLVVEDSPAMRGFIASIVDQIEGCEAVEVDGGFQALRELPRERFDLVITDINMPDINGLELLSFIRKNPSYSQTPVLVVTSEQSAAERERSLALGATAFVAKPFEADALSGIIRELLGVA